MKPKFVAYYRVSTDKQGLQRNGIEAQKQAVAPYLASLDCELLGNFVDNNSDLGVAAAGVPLNFNRIRIDACHGGRSDFGKHPTFMNISRKKRN